MSKVIIAAFLATSAIALEVRPLCSGHDQNKGCTAIAQAAAASARPLDIVAAASHRGAGTDEAVR